MLAAGGKGVMVDKGSAKAAKDDAVELLFGEGVEARGDRRVVRTKRAIRAAFMKLLEDYDFNKITITALAREADIDRKTFYLHYRSVDALADEIIQEEADRITEACHKSLTETGEFLSERGTVEMFKQLAVGLALSPSSRKLIVSHLPYDEVVKRLAKSLEASILRDDFIGFSDRLGPYLEYCVSYFSTGFVATLRCWVERDSELPLDDIAKMTYLMSFSGLNGLLSAVDSGKLATA